MTLVYGVCVWGAGVGALFLGVWFPVLSPLEWLWLVLMPAAAVFGILGAARSMKAGTWPTVVLFPAGIVLVIVSGLGLIAPFGM